ncbi:hypothetical protein L6164_021840 [Bauhinia variegata]|uniref:Uncharacterized protein n=1 Tax=Bauhinia variegata TaxID=167791 RepID=A0ACB9MDA0_BAUVA|nr:hypothetical protein L6164_021840 [Bauhinia variegata]
MATTFLSLSPSPVATFFFKPCFSLTTRTAIPSKTAILFRDPFHFHIISKTSYKFPRNRAAPDDVVPSAPTTVETSQEIVSATDDGVSTVISALLFVAFVGLSIVTIGVIYLGVTDFLQKREKDKFEKEEAAGKSGKKKKKKRVRAKAGPRGFGQKIDGDEEDD